MKLTPFGKIFIVLALLVAAFFSVRHYAPGMLDKIIPGAKVRTSVVPSGANLPNVAPNASTRKPRPAA
jgi:hypothetical protein